MAKKAPSKHSRAARRATSPSIDTDKSLKNVKPPEESVNHRPAVLAAHHNAGVTKKAKTGRKAAMSSRARRRHEKGMDRAEAVLDRTALKIAKSHGQARAIQGRRKAWEDINAQALEVAEAVAEQKKSAKQKRAEAEQAAVDEFFRNDKTPGDDDDDEEMGRDDDDAEPETDAAKPAPPPPANDDDDEIL